MGERWESLSAAEATIRFDAPGLEEQRVRRLRSNNTTARSTLEVAVWTGAAATHPKARVLYIKAWPRYHFRASRDPKAAIQTDRIFDGKDIEFGASERSTNGLGTIETRRFAFDDVECVGFSEYWGQSGFDTSNAGTNWLQGYYCADPGEALGDETIAVAVQSLRIGDAAEPAETVRAVVRLPLRVTLATAGESKRVYSGKLSLTEEVRISAFDIELTWPYGDCSGQSEIRGGTFGDGGEVVGVWNIVCVNGETATGWYWGQAPDMGRGEGRSSDGATIEFQYGERIAED